MRSGALYIGTGILWCVLASGAEIDFNRDIRPILSNHCLTCHGPDEAQRKANLRLDTAEGSRADRGGHAAIVPGVPEESELLRRVVDPGEDRMPPPEIGKDLDEAEIGLLRQWIEEGGDYDLHWAYAVPRRPIPPANQERAWERNPVDAFVLAGLEAAGLGPSDPSDPGILARRAALDLTGLPPTLETVESFLSDTRPDAWERYVERLLHHPGFGERWASMWLDLARYADSAGYADDPIRTIWAWRDWVIDAYNRNMPFDRFTMEQLAGDLLPGEDESRLVATAFHRNTMTNNEGGTTDEQWRNEAVVDRVNTTMQVWMGTTIACAQCHTHKYDPITQEEYFRMFAIFNNTEDSDKRDERPFLLLHSREQKERKARWHAEMDSLRESLERPDPEVDREREEWIRRLSALPDWARIHPVAATSGGRTLTIEAEGVVKAEGEKPERDVYRIRFETGGEAIRALRLETDAQKDNFALSRVEAHFERATPVSHPVRHVRIRLPGKGRILSLAEVRVFSNGENIALSGRATQSSTAYEGVASRAVDDNTSGDYERESTTHTASSDDPWWELDLTDTREIDRIEIWNRTAPDPSIGERLAGLNLQLLDSRREVIWESTHPVASSPRLAVEPGRSVPVVLSDAFADYAQRDFDASSVLAEERDDRRAWAVGGRTGRPHWLTLVLERPLEGVPGTIEITLRQESRHARHLIDSFSLYRTGEESLVEHARLPEDIRKLLRRDPGSLDREERERLAAGHRQVSRILRSLRERLAELQSLSESQKPYTTVPVMRELSGESRRRTRVQIRGDYRNLDAEVTEGTPAVFHPVEGERPDRLDLARWLVSRENPLTARVIVNRYWERLFGTGIVATSEEFGSQGDLPSHPRLLDWLAVEFMESGWDRKHLLRLLMHSATYRQTSRAAPRLLEVDPENRLLSRGPRIRLEAEMVRDQALALGGLLTGELFGPPARPPQPSTGLTAAFGSGIDWKTSRGKDRYRRGLYTQWRRSNPYPSMVSFDAPNREVCTVRRPRSNTPLQALVTLNDPVYVEAAQGLARRIAALEGSIASRMKWAFRCCLLRAPGPQETARLIELHQRALDEFRRHPEAARTWAGAPPGAPEGSSDWPELAAWTTVANTLLNLDEIFLKP